MKFSRYFFAVTHSNASILFRTDCLVHKKREFVNEIHAGLHTDRAYGEARMKRMVPRTLFINFMKYKI